MGTVWKLHEFSLTHFWQKFRESNGFTIHSKKLLNSWFDFFSESNFFFIFPCCEMGSKSKMNIFFVKSTKEITTKESWFHGKVFSVIAQHCNLTSENWFHVIFSMLSLFYILSNNDQILTWFHEKLSIYIFWEEDRRRGGEKHILPHGLGNMKLVGRGLSKFWRVFSLCDDGGLSLLFRLPTKHWIWWIFVWTQKSKFLFFVFLKIVFVLIIDEYSSLSQVDSFSFLINFCIKTS